LPVGETLAPRGVLFLWAACPRLDAAIQCIERWGLHYRGVAFVWVKTRKDGGVIGAQGVRPSIVKPTTEMVLVASRVRTGRPMPLADESIAQVVLAPRREHSAKPDEVQSRIERMYPHARRIELFARRLRQGWDAWGDEIGGLVSESIGSPSNDATPCRSSCAHKKPP
jgi:N6-adenosine-specific RNA methylase IME4